MKKRIAFLALLLAALLSLNSCGLLLLGLDRAQEIMESQADSSCVSDTQNGIETVAFTPTEINLNDRIHSFYHSLDAQEKQLYSNICGSIENFSDGYILVGTYESKEDYEAARDRAMFLYSHLIYEQPQYFWAKLSGISVSYIEREGVYTLYISPVFLLERQEVDSKKKVLNEEVDKIVEAASEKETDFEKLLYVYDYIIESAVYDNAISDSKDPMCLDRSVYGALVSKKTVCSGYALAFNLVLKRMGRDCGVEFDFLKGDPETDEPSHVWNYCKMDDGEYYYFDLTWDDSAFNKTSISDKIDNPHLYFAIDKNELLKTHTVSPQSVSPECNGRKYNYFVYNSYNMKEYDYKSARKLLNAQRGNDYFVLRFDSEEALAYAKKKLADDADIYKIFIGKLNKLSVSQSGCGLHLFFFET